jgi:ribosomal protein L17
MKNRIRFRKLGRTSSHRMALFRNMVTSLIKYERVKTTLPKAKELRTFADKVVTWAKRGAWTGQGTRVAPLAGNAVQRRRVHHLTSLLRWPGLGPAGERQHLVKLRGFVRTKEEVKKAWTELGARYQ